MSQISAKYAPALLRFGVQYPPPNLVTKIIFIISPFELYLNVVIVHVVLQPMTNSSLVCFPSKSVLFIRVYGYFKELLKLFGLT